MGRTVMMRWSGDRFFLLTKTLSKSEIAAVHIDGSAATVVATVEGEATSIAADDASVYFTVAETLYRVPRSGGEVQKVAAPFGYDVVLDDQRAYAIGFDKKDVVVRSIAKSGGEVTTLVRRTMTGTREPYFRRIAVQGERLYFSDKDTRVLVEVSKRDGSILRTDDDVGLVSELVVTPTSAFLTYEPNGELRRIDLATGKKERITSNHGGLNAIGSHDIYMWALCQEYPNSQPCPLYKRSLEGGEAVVVDNLRSNLEALAVDDECLYLVRQNDLAPLGGGEGVQTVVQAMAKP